MLYPVVFAAILDMTFRSNLSSIRKKSIQICSKFFTHFLFSHATDVLKVIKMLEDW